MDFIEGLGDTSCVPEIAVDGLGRAELYMDRLRITLVRATNCNGSVIIQPALCIAWTVAAFQAANMHRDRMLQLVLNRESINYERLFGTRAH